MPPLNPSLRSLALAAATAAVATPSTAAAQSPAPALTIESAPYGAYAGTAVPLRARWQPAAGAASELVDTLVAWRSSNSLTAWVGLDGQLYFDRPGRVTLTATRSGVSVARRFEVVEPRADRLTLDASGTPMRAGDTVSLGARVWHGDRDQVRDARLAYGVGIRGAERASSVDTAGRFSAAAPGGYTVMAVLGPVGASVVVPVTIGGAPATVTAPLAKHADRGDGLRDVSIDQPDDYAPYVGTSIPLVARVVPEAGTTAPAVVWSSDDPATAWVDAGGVVHFLRRGSVEIAATAGGHRATRSFRVAEATAYRVLLRASTGATATVVGDSVRLGAEAWVLGGARLQHPRFEYAVWTADGAATAPRVTITEEGVFVAHAPGTYTVMTTLGGHASSVVIPVDGAAR